MAKISFKQQVLLAREDAIITAVNRLLADKGFDLMTVDEVAAEVGIAKASLYKHFASKEALAAAAMVRVMEKAMAFISSRQALGEGPSPLDHLQAVARWTMEVQLAGEMPSLPSQNSTLREELSRNALYIDRLMQVSEALGVWITLAQQRQQINPALPAEVVLYTLFARACDPVLGLLKAQGNYSHDEILNFSLASCFQGLCAR
jgi:TetR/AcrR family transcriptional regulator of autoinduction and epiphytic fitness